MAEHAFIMKRGVVTEVAGEEVVGLHHSSDVFGCEGVTGVRFRAFGLKVLRLGGGGMGRVETPHRSRPTCSAAKVSPGLCARGGECARALCAPNIAVLGMLAETDLL